MKRLNEIARKTGLSEKETRQFTKIGFWSFIAFVFMGIFGCASAVKLEVIMFKYYHLAQNMFRV